MAIERDMQVPARRTAGLAVRPRGNETLVLDLESDTAHCLPAQVAAVWAACDGTRSVAAIAEVARVDPETAAASVSQLMDVQLLDSAPGLDRRRFLRRTVVVGAGVATAPLIQSVIAPAVTAAASAPKVAVAVKTGCGSSNRLVYTLTLQNFAPNTTYYVLVTYKGGNVTDALTVTTDGSGGVISTGNTTGSAVPQDTSATVSVYSDSAHTQLVYQGAPTTWTHC